MTRFETAVLKRSALLICLGIASAASAAEIQLRDGRILKGDLGETAGVAEDPTAPKTQAGAIRTTPILVVEDGLRRTFLHRATVTKVIDEGRDARVRIPVWQREAKRGAPLGVIGAPSRVDPFDEFGRRTIWLPSNQGSIAVIQGVTEVTPVFTRVQGLRAEPRSYLWDMRLATSSLPRATLSRILARAIPREGFDKRMLVVRLYFQAERYRDAARELEQVRKDFADEPGVSTEELDKNLASLRDLAARGLLDEIELWQGAGRYTQARALLERFPTEGIDGDTLRRVRELLDEDEARRADRDDLLEVLRSTIGSLREEAARAVAKKLLKEIEQRLTPATADRMTAFQTLASGGSLEPDALMAIAMSGWLMGSNKAIESLPTALTLVKVREQVRQYLAAETLELRESAFVTIRDTPEATVPRVAAILARIEPPLPLAEPNGGEPEALAPGLEPGTQDDPGADASGWPELPAGCFPLKVKVGERVIESLVQLPPEYDPLRRYPTIVTLGDLGASVGGQLDFWAGAPVPKVGRIGQAMRRGYVVVSIDWDRTDQLRYEYTSAEHAAVLATLRDAMRRVAIDTDRVYLTGHGAGGDLAWDLALAHPDHWAGVIPFLATADRYVKWYSKNAEHVPLRFVIGELDGNKIEKNARELDRCLKPTYDATVVEYRGRGYDPLSDDLQRTFDWMGRKTRGKPPEEFECSTMRPWDNYFWWIEAEGLPEKSMVLPAQWPRKGARAASVRGRKFVGNKLGIYTQAERVTVWLTPDLIDFEKPVEITHNGRRLVDRKKRVNPDLRVLLEDARTRAERQRPYWAKVESR